MRIRPPLTTRDVDGGDVGAQRVDWSVTALVSIPAALLGIVSSFVALADEGGSGAAVAAGGIFALPVVVAAAAYLVRKHGQFLELDDGVLRYRNWRGTVTALGAPQEVIATRGQVRYDAALALDVPVVVLEGADGVAPVLLRARHWRRTELLALWRRLKIRPVGGFERVYSAEQLTTSFPGIALPWSLSHPGAIWAGITLGILGWIALGIVLLVRLLG